jgi:hypothetical protein
MAQTVLGGTIDFLGRLGVYDVLLPFLLVFTLVFAFLEKTKVLGVEIVKDKSGTEHSFTRKNLNAVVAFCIGFFVIASSQLVRVISEVMANVIILIVTAVCFMLAIGVYHTGQEEMEVGKKWKPWLWGLSAAAILLILFNALGWLETIFEYASDASQSGWFATIILVLVFVGLMFWITSSPKHKVDSKS